MSQKIAAYRPEMTVNILWVGDVKARDEGCSPVPPVVCFCLDAFLPTVTNLAEMVLKLEVEHVFSQITLKRMSGFISTTG